MVNLKLKQFNGPLDLLLSLLAEKKLEVSELALGEVTEQFLTHLDTLEENRAEELADFLVVATKLLLVKSRGLMPQFGEEEEDELSIEAQLRLYKAFVEASKKVNTLWQNNLSLSPRVEPPRQADGFIWPENINLDRMQQSMVRLVSRLKPRKPLPQTTIDKAISMKQKIDRIRHIVSSSKQVHFFEIIEESQNKTEIIVSFLALLELVKLRTISLRQDQTFSDIVIERV